MELKEFVGSHVLKGVDYEGGNNGANAIRFKLDDTIYIAIEDENDGYRSCLGSVDISFEKMLNTFKGIKVIGRLNNNEDMLIFVSKKSGKPILTIGTDYSDDYYPCFVSDWNPSNI